MIRPIKNNQVSNLEKEGDCFRFCSIPSLGETTNRVGIANMVGDHQNESRVHKMNSKTKMKEVFVYLYLLEDRAVLQAVNVQIVAANGGVK